VVPLWTSPSSATTGELEQTGIGGYETRVEGSRHSRPHQRRRYLDNTRLEHGCELGRAANHRLAADVESAGHRMEQRRGVRIGEVLGVDGPIQFPLDRDP